MFSTYQESGHWRRTSDHFPLSMAGVLKVDVARGGMNFQERAAAI
jgi:hypothetical protein